MSIYTLIDGTSLQSLPEAKVTEGVSIDDYGTWFAERFAGPEGTL